MKSLKLTTKKLLLIGLSGVMLGVSIYGGLTYLSTRVKITGILGYISIRVDPAYATLPVQNSWVNAIPVQTDDTNFQWINGKPYIYMNITSSATPSLSNAPGSKAFGVVAESSTYYAKGSAPNNPVVNGDCTFTITNDGATQIDTTIYSSNATGGVGWTVTSGAPGANTFRQTAYYSGQNPASGVVLTNSPQAFKQDIAASGTAMWDFMLETGTFTDGVGKTWTITITAAAG